MDEPADVPHDDLDGLEKRALLAAVAEARADTGPDVEHEAFEQQAERERAELLERAASLPAG